MQNSEIQDLIVRGKVKLLLERLSTETQDRDNRSTYTLLLGRFNSNEKQRAMGIIYDNNYNIERNKIVAAILELNSIDKLPPQQQNQSEVMTTKQKLSDLSVSLKRKNVALHQECEAILSKYKEYEDKKRLQPTFDIVGRRFQLIENEALQLLSKANENKLDSKEAFIERVNSLLSEAIPTYIALQEAYTLLVGKGFNNEFVALNLELKPEDSDVRVEIAEIFEAFLAKL